MRVLDCQAAFQDAIDAKVFAARAKKNAAAALALLKTWGLMP